MLTEELLPCVLAPLRELRALAEPLSFALSALVASKSIFCTAKQPEPSLYAAQFEAEPQLSHDEAPGVKSLTRQNIKIAAIATRIMISTTPTYAPLFLPYHSHVYPQ